MRIILTDFQAEGRLQLITEKYIYAKKKAPEGALNIKICN